MAEWFLVDMLLPRQAIHSHVSAITNWQRGINLIGFKNHF